MSRYIDADALSEKMFHEAFEKDTQDQKWDSGCWIRYHMFEDAIDSIPAADVVEVVRCKDCKFRGHIQLCPFGKRAMPHANGYCCYGERRTDDVTD